MPKATGLTPSERRMRASLAAHQSWANTPDPTARSKPGRDAAFTKFELEVDPDRVLDPEERRRRAEHLRKAHMKRLALLSAKARRLKAAGQ